MNKRDVLDLLQINQAELAKILGITRSAVAQWPADRPIPERQLLRLKFELRPVEFSKLDDPHPEPRREAA